MRYLLLIYGDEAAAAAMAAEMTQEQQAAQAKFWYDYGELMPDLR